MGEAVVNTLQAIIPSDEWTIDLRDAWEDFFKFITRLMKEGMAKGLQLADENHS